MQLTEDFLRAEYIRVMGADLGLLYSELEADFDWLDHKWREYHEIFDGGPERIELLNSTASNFFYFLQKLLFEDAMLHLSRLTDPPELGLSKDKTLTLFQLERVILDPTLKAAVEIQVAEIRKECAFARTWRNKRLAHTDLKKLRKGTASLPTVNSTQVDGAIGIIKGLLDVVARHFKLPPSVNLTDPWGAKALFAYLEKDQI